MNGYDLRVWKAGNRTTTPDRVEVFEAVDDDAIAHLRNFVNTCNADEDVWLFPAGGGRGTSLASEQGSVALRSER